MLQSRGTASGPPQWWVSGASAAAGNARASVRSKPRADVLVALVARVDRARQAVGGAAAADRDAPVGRALGVEEEVVAVVDQQAVAPARARPHLVGQRRGRDHQRVERQVAQALAGQLRRVGLGRAEHDRGAHASRRRSARGPARSRCAAVRSKIVTPWRSHAAASPRTSRAGSIRAAWGVNQPPRTPGIETNSSTCAASSSRPSSCLAARVRRAGAQARPLRVARGDRQRARLAVAAVDLLARDDLADLIDGVEGGAQRAPAPVAVARDAEGLRAADEAADRPAAVAPRRPEARDLALDHAHAQIAAGAFAGSRRSTGR